MAVVIGPLLGGLTGAAVYYSVSSTIANQTSSIRSDLHDCAQALDYHATSTGSFSKQPTSTPLQLGRPSTLSSSYNPDALPPTFGDLVRARWNAVISNGVSSVETTDWSNVLAGAYHASVDLARQVTNSTSTLAGSSAPSASSGLSSGSNATAADSIQASPPRDVQASSGLESQASTTSRGWLDSLANTFSSTNTSTNKTPIAFEGGNRDRPLRPQDTATVFGDRDLLKRGNIGSLNDGRIDKTLGTDDVGQGRLV